MIPYENTWCVLPMLFDAIPIENFIFSLLHAGIGIGNKIISSFYTWISTYIEPLSVEEIEMINKKIDSQIEWIDIERKLTQWNKHNITIMADLINENKIIESALKEKDDKNQISISGEYKLNAIMNLQ